MSTPVVFIGFVLLAPSILGMLLGLLGLASTLSSANDPQESSRVRAEERSKMERQGVPEAIIGEVLSDTPVRDTELRTLAPAQAQTVKEARVSIDVGKVGRGAGVLVAGGFSLAAIVGSLVGGLLGWLLIMRKRILQCTYCGAVVAAS